MSSSAAAAPLSPTRCRPQHLDRERLRGALSSAQLADVVLQEAVVVASRATPKSFRLLALAPDCVCLFPLASSQVSATPPTRIAFTRVVVVDAASPTLAEQRGMMLEPTSQLFCIVVREGEGEVPTSTVSAADASSATLCEYFVSTFEPDSRVFFYVRRAFLAHFQAHGKSAILLPPAARRQQHEHTREELAELLDSLVAELVAEPEHLKKSVLLRELAVAGTCNRRLQSLFFANRARLVSASAVGESDQSDGVAAIGASCVGLPALLIRDLSALLATASAASDDDDAGLRIGSLEYAASALDVLARMCFCGDLLPERLHFFLETPLDSLVAIVTSPVRRRCWRHRGMAPIRGGGDDGDDGDDEEAAATLAAEEILDAQVALALELEALQQEASVVAGTHLSHRQSTHVPQLMLRSQVFPTWVGKLFKRICRSVARAELELGLLRAKRREGSHWSLALWRSARLLDMLWSADANVLSLLRETRVDYLNLYLRSPRALEALRSSDAGSHVRETAGFLERFLDAVTQHGR